MRGGSRRRKKPGGDVQEVRDAGVESPSDSPADAGRGGERGGGEETEGSGPFKAWQLEKIEECAAVGCTLEEAADNAETTQFDILDSEEAMSAFRRGSNKARFELGKTIMDLAKQGQPQMVAQALKLFERQASEMPIESLPPLGDEIPE